MITRSNLLTEYLRIPQNILPKALRQEEFDFIVENFDLLGEDEDIDKYVDTLIEKLNDVSEKQTSNLESAFIKMGCNDRGSGKSRKKGSWIATRKNLQHDRYGKA